MKDIKTSLGGGTEPKTEGVEGKIKGFTARNKGQWGRRIGIFTNSADLTVGPAIHAADYRHTPEDVIEEEMIYGLPFGKTVELAGRRNYQKIFSFTAPAPFQTLAKADPIPNTRMSSVHATGFENATAYDPATSVVDVMTGLAALPRDYIARNHFSFTIILSGTAYELSLDVNRHPARITADLNHQLSNINHNLRAFVSIAKDGVNDLRDSAVWEVYLAVTSAVTVYVPRTNYTTEAITGLPLSRAGLASFNVRHLNNDLAQGLQVKRDVDMIPYDMSPIADPRLATAKTVVEAIAAIKKWPDVAPAGSYWSITHILQPSDFFYLKQDTRLKIALIEISPKYNQGDLHRWMTAAYVNNGVDTYADVAVFERSNGEGVYGTRLIDLDASLAAGRLIGAAEQAIAATDHDQYVAETGGLNGIQPEAGTYGSRLALAVIAPPTEYRRLTPLFREPTGDVNLRLMFYRDASNQPNFTASLRDVDWSKEVDARVPIQLALPVIPNATVTKITVEHESGTITEVGPTVTTDGSFWVVNLQDGFSQRDLSFFHTEGRINYKLELNRYPGNNTALTKLNWAESIDYTVNIPTVLGKMDLETIPSFIIDSENNDLVTFAGKLNLPIDAPEGSKFPLYYSDDVTLTASVNGESAAVASGVFVEPTNMGLDEEGNFTFSISKAALSEFGEGTHTLSIHAELHHYWNNWTNLTGSVQFVIRPFIVGVEDDVTFYTPASYDANSDSVNSNLRVVDLDTGEILAEGATLDALIADAETRGLVEIDTIYGAS